MRQYADNISFAKTEHSDGSITIDTELVVRCRVRGFESDYPLERIIEISIELLQQQVAKQSYGFTLSAPTTPPQPSTPAIEQPRPSDDHEPE